MDLRSLLILQDSQSASLERKWYTLQEHKQDSVLVVHLLREHTDLVYQARGLIRLIRWVWLASCRSTTTRLWRRRRRRIYPTTIYTSTLHTSSTISPTTIRTTTTIRTPSSSNTTFTGTTSTSTTDLFISARTRTGQILSCIQRR